MRILALVFQYVCFAAALYLSYQTGLKLYQQDYQLMEIVADIGTILICIDLGVFLLSSNLSQGMSLKQYAQQLDRPVNKVVKFTRKLGHLGIILILCSWIVPMINS